MPRIAETVKRLLLVLLLAVSAGGAAAAAAGADLDQAKREGLVGETMEGYVGLVDDSAPAEVKVLVEEVNARRRAEYQRIAEQNDIRLAEVEALAAKKAIDKTRRGDWVRVNGTWRQK